MHIEPGVVTGAKLLLSYATAAGALTYGAKLAFEDLKGRGVLSLAARAGIASTAVFGFFQVLPHVPVGVSEVHLILGSSLMLILGTAPAAIGLVLGLLVQGLFFAPFDLPQYGMNVTTLLVPLFALSVVAARTIRSGTAYVDLDYASVLKLSLTYQGGVVAWVAFWAIYGQGFAHLASVATFGLAYMTVVLVEPLVDLGLLALAKRLRGLEGSALVSPRLHTAG